MSLNITITQLKADITQQMKGTSLDQIGDFYGTVGGAADRMNARIDTQETRRIVTLATPFFDDVQDYACPTDFKSMIDLRPQTARYNNANPESGGFSGTTSRQFTSRMTWDSFSIQWNSGVRSLRAQRLPNGSVITLDEFSSPTSNGSWTAEGDSAAAWDEALNWDQGLQINWDNGLYVSPLNVIQGSNALGFNLSGATGAADIVNTTATVLDLSALNYQDSSMVFFFIPLGHAARFTSFTLRRGSSPSDYVSVTVTQKSDGTPFTDGWNLLLFNWDSGTVTGIPDDTKNTYRYFGVVYTAGTLIKGCLIDSWTDALGDLYVAEYYSECLFRDATTGAWKYRPTLDTDIVNVGPASYEILKTEMMVDITRQIRTGAIRIQELTDLRLMLNGQPQSRYVKDPPYHGLYQDYVAKFPTSAIPIVTSTYYFEV